MGTASALPINEYAQLLFNEATDGLFIASPQGIYLTVNHSGNKMLGYEDGELVGKHITAIIPGHEISRLEPALAALTEGSSQTEFWELLRKDGRLIHIELRAQKLSNGLLLGIAREPAPRDQYERQVKLSEARLWSILQTAPDIILTVDRSGKILFINRVVPPATLDQVIGASCFDFVPPESRDRVAAAIHYVFDTRQIDEYEVRRPPDVHGKTGWSSVRVGPLIKDDEVIAVTMCATDVSAYKCEVARTQELLERLNKIASQVPGMVFQFKRTPDGSTAFPYVSNYIQNLFNVSPESVRDDASVVFAQIHPDDVSGIYAALNASVADHKPIYYEFRVLDDSKVRWFSCYAAIPETDVDGSNVWHGFSADITERKETEQLRARLEEQLMQSHKMESIGQLAGGVAHDFNNLLTIMTGFVDLSLDELPDNSPVRNYLKGIKNAATRGATLTQQLVAFARKKIVRPELVNLNSVLDHMVPMIRRLLGEHITVDLTLSDNLPLVKVDMGSMEQVLMNLVVNARDAMTNGGQLTIRTNLAIVNLAQHSLQSQLKAGEYVVLSICDTGSGMTENVKARLFEPFFTTKPQGAGTGLGLAMCHGIVNQAKGAIAVKSELNKGTMFEIYLPCHQGEFTAANAPSTPIHTKTGNETLLIVEDEPMILQLVTNTLAKLGYHILAANDGVEALEVTRNASSPIDLLITDVIMPRLGGRELASRLQQQHPQLKVLYMSGYAENAIAHQGELPQGLNFIQKPYQPAELAARVREVLDRN